MKKPTKPELTATVGRLLNTIAELEKQLKANTEVNVLHAHIKEQEDLYDALVSQREFDQTDHKKQMDQAIAEQRHLSDIAKEAGQRHKSLRLTLATVNEKLRTAQKNKLLGVKKLKEQLREVTREKATCSKALNKAIAVEALSVQERNIFDKEHKELKDKYRRLAKDLGTQHTVNREQAKRLLHFKDAYELECKTVHKAGDIAEENRAIQAKQANQISIQTHEIKRLKAELKETDSTVDDTDAHYKRVIHQRDKDVQILQKTLAVANNKLKELSAKDINQEACDKYQHQITSLTDTNVKLAKEIALLQRRLSITSNVEVENNRVDTLLEIVSRLIDDR